MFIPIPVFRKRRRGYVASREPRGVPMEDWKESKWFVEWLKLARHEGNKKD
jgi:hypothetical protein